jgi:hypothetical protein
MTSKKSTTYPVKRGSRYDRLMLRLVRDWVVEGLEEIDIENKGKPFSERSDFHRIAQLDTEPLDMYCRLVVYTDNDPAGKRPNLNGKGAAPLPGASRLELAKGFERWFMVDEEITQAIDDDILEVNKPPAPRHILPKEMLTEEEKSDPNS